MDINTFWYFRHFDMSPYIEMCRNQSPVGLSNLDVVKQMDTIRTNMSIFATQVTNN